MTTTDQKTLKCCVGALIGPCECLLHIELSVFVIGPCDSHTQADFTSFCNTTEASFTAVPHNQHRPLPRQCRIVEFKNWGTTVIRGPLWCIATTGWTPGLGSYCCCTISTRKCMLHTAITHIVTVLKWWSLAWIPMVYTYTLPFQYYNHASGCRVQCAIRTKNCGTSVHTLPTMEGLKKNVGVKDYTEAVIVHVFTIHVLTDLSVSSIPVSTAVRLFRNYMMTLSKSYWKREWWRKGDMSERTGKIGTLFWQWGAWPTTSHRQTSPRR